MPEEQEAGVREQVVVPQRRIGQTFFNKASCLFVSYSQAIHVKEM